MIVAYYDDKNLGNLSHLEKEVFDYSLHSIGEARRAGFVVKESRSRLVPYPEKGIYFIKVREHADTWLGATPHTENILNHIPERTIKALKQEQIILVIDNTEEGKSLNYEKANGFQKIHDFMKMHELPPFSVLIFNGDKLFNHEYENWCIKKKVTPRIAHCYGLAGFFYFENKIPKNPLVLKAIRDLEAKSFNSLNRTGRLQRFFHLFYLIDKNLVENNVVSGLCDINKTMTPKELVENYFDINHKYFTDILMENLPIFVDGDWSQKIEYLDETARFNHDIYKSSLLTFVTETNFFDPGLFITEKVFKPIVAGHPFILLGQKGVLKFLQTLGYETDFYGIDQSYDDIENDKERFFCAHQSLEKWISLSRRQKNQIILKNIPILEHNMKHFYNNDHLKDSFINLKNTVNQIFKKKYRIFYEGK